MYQQTVTEVVFLDTIQVVKATEEEMEDRMLYDGDQQRYLQLLANGGEEDMGIDASDVDSSDVASSNDIESDSDSEDEDKLRSSVARSEGRGKRGRAAIGASSQQKSDPNPLLAEIASKSERRQAATQRWFNDPLFAEVDETPGAAAVKGEDVIVEDERERDSGDEGKPTAKRSKRDANRGRRKGKEEDTGEKEGVEGRGAAADLLAAMPKTEKQKRHEKRKKVTYWNERQADFCRSRCPTLNIFWSTCRPIVYVAVMS